MRILRFIFIWTFRFIKYSWLTLWTLYQIALGIVLVGLIWLGFQGSQLFFRYSHVLEIKALQSRPPDTTAFIQAERRLLRDSLRLAHQRGTRSLPDTAIRWNWIPLDSIPHTLVDMALVAEDSKFYTHEGFDLEQIEYAIVANHQSGHAARGASTITQQVAKNLYLSSGKEMQRKLHEAALVLLLEHYLTKDRILEIYLNIAQFGRGVYGIREAARFHFNREPQALTQDQMLSLVCLLPSPERWNPKRPSPGFVAHKQQVLRNYALFRGIRSFADTSSPTWMRDAYDSLGNLLAEQRWKKLRTNSGVPFSETTEGSATAGEEAAGQDTSEIEGGR